MPITITDEKTIWMAQDLANIIDDTPAAAVDLAVRGRLADERVYRARKAVRRMAHTLTEEEFYAKLSAITDRYRKERPPAPHERGRPPYTGLGLAPYEDYDRV